MITIDDLRMTYRSGAEQVHGARGVSFEVGQGQFFTLLGPSGCGKTTTLRCVAGLEQPDDGQIVVADTIVFSASARTWVPPFKRNIGMVFQSYAIWPHMTVFENVAFPLRYSSPRPSKSQIRDRVLKALALVQLDDYVDRPAPNLSGGQQQRLALARALVGEPRVLLLDEPLSNLDAKLREQMRVELRDLVKRLNVTTLFVTHEQIEALTMSDVVAVMKDGAIVQCGTPRDIYMQPKDAFVAEFIGRTNVIPGQPTGPNGREVVVNTDIGSLVCTATPSFDSRLNTVVAIRPEDIEIGDSAGENTFEARVERLSFLGDAVDCFVRVRDRGLVVKVHPSRAPETGTTVRLHVAASRCLAMSSPTLE